MKVLAVRREGATVGMLRDHVLCHDVRDAGGSVVGHKGALVSEDLAARILLATWNEIHVIAAEPGDLHEEEGGQRLAKAVVGEGVEVKGYTGGQWTLAATRRGLLRIQQSRLTDVNVLDGISVFTLFDGQPVEPGETVAKAKVTPLVIAEKTLVAVEEIARVARGLMSVLAFRPECIGVVARERLEVRQRSRFEAALQQKVDWFGGRLLAICYAGDSATAVATDLRSLRSDGARLLVVAGASALDPLDAVFGGLTLVGARMERHGAPAHPGSLLWLADWEGLPVLGMPTCGMFSQATTFDLVLPRLLAGEPVDNRALAALGHGGLLSRDMAYRFPPYRAGVVRGELE
jgi:hypothetical protein